MSIQEWEFRSGRQDDALCVGVLATQVFVDTYATSGVAPHLAREVIDLYSPDAFGCRLADPATTFLLAERAAHLGGFAEITRGRLCPGSPAGPDVELVRLYVQRGFQRRGLGRELLRRAAAVAEADGASALWLSVWEGNEAARAFYRDRGLVRVAEVDHVIADHSYRNLVLVLRIDREA